MAAGGGGSHTAVIAAAGLPGRGRKVIGASDAVDRLDRYLEELPSHGCITGHENRASAIDPLVDQARAPWFLRGASQRAFEDPRTLPRSLLEAGHQIGPDSEPLGGLRGHGQKLPRGLPFGPLAGAAIKSLEILLHLLVRIAVGAGYVADFDHDQLVRALNNEVVRAALRRSSAGAGVALDDLVSPNAGRPGQGVQQTLDGGELIDDLGERLVVGTDETSEVGIFGQGAEVDYTTLGDAAPVVGGLDSNRMRLR